MVLDIHLGMGNCMACMHVSITPLLNKQKIQDHSKIL